VLSCRRPSARRRGGGGPPSGRPGARAFDGRRALSVRRSTTCCHVPFRRARIPAYDAVVGRRKRRAFGGRSSGAVPPSSRSLRASGPLRSCCNARRVAHAEWKPSYPELPPSRAPQSGRILDDPRFSSHQSVTLQLPAVLAKLATARFSEVQGSTFGDVVADVAAARFPRTCAASARRRRKPIPS